MKSRLIGITGSIATGKSTASQYIHSKGYPVIDADKIAHQLMEIGQINYKQIVDKFGKEILNDDKTINRKKLGQIVFSDKNKLEELNNLTHRNIFNRIVSSIEECDSDIIFVDVPLMIELLSEKKFPIELEDIWLIYVNREIQLQRLMARDKINSQEALNKLNKQMDIEEKKKYADVIIDNSGDLKNLFKKIDEKLGKL